MVPCTSKDSSKKTIGTKTILFEYNKFVVCSDDGCPNPIDMNPIDSYCGVEYGGGEAFKNPAYHLLTNFILVIDNWNSKEEWFWQLVYFFFFGISSTGAMDNISTGTVRTGRLGKDLAIRKKDIEIAERESMKLFYEENGI